MLNRTIIVPTKIKTQFWLVVQSKKAIVQTREI
nr:MAG TPA: hypothetical protein [Caudoviricetes sp.]